MSTCFEIMLKPRYVTENYINCQIVTRPRSRAVKYSIMGTAVLNVTTKDELQLVDQTDGFGGEASAASAKARELKRDR
jgi:hypothetical protein